MGGHLVDGLSGRSPQGQHNGVRLTVRKFYNLATTNPLMSGYAHDEEAALSDLTAVLGPLPKEWVDSLGMQIHLQPVLTFN